jgi:transcriptional regulator with XRE-family HTH domain
VVSEPLKTTVELEKQLGADVRRVRHQRQLTQAELAERANVSLSAVKYLESGRGSSLSTLVRVTGALGRTEWLTSFAPPEPAFSPLAILRATEQAKNEAPKRVRHATLVRPRS